MSAARSKGTAYENHVRDTYLRRVWPDADRAPLRGIHDFGDFDHVGGRLVEAKKRDRWDLPAWIRGVLTKIGGGPAPWEIVFAGDKRGPIPMDLVVAPAEQYYGYLDHMTRLEVEVMDLHAENQDLQDTIYRLEGELEAIDLFDDGETS